MNPPFSTRQIYFRVKFARRAVLVCVGLVVAGAGVWFFYFGNDTPPPPAQPQAAPAARARAVPLARAAEIVRKAETSRTALAAPPAVAPPALAPEAGVSQLEQRYRGERGTAARGDIAREIAGANNAEAVLALGRLFQSERNMVARLALLVALGDVDEEAAPEARMATLTFALHGQPRDIRIAALDSLAQLDDPRALALLRRTRTEDADIQVRETAAALYEARAGEDTR